MVRPRDQEIPAMERLLLTVPRRRDTPHYTTQGHIGKHRGPVGSRGNRGKCGQESLLWFLQEGMWEAG